ncbi:citrate/2-methylcitrate synthase [Clostridium sp. Marseille-P299]|uniref:citrate/2-methylcitrate synthase n=1 Tax=Clostridium sp. Marseille-P299 TaxID=1805477 RepID=UPI00082CC84F|nr:citrate/2-methylcitrate synthase [Clostridium sp. Marseille-P299]
MQEVIFQITPQVKKLVEVCERCDKVESDLYKEYDVKRGLRDINGKGVVAGLTNISEVHAKDIVKGEEVPCEGKLYYRGYDIRNLTQGFLSEGRFGFEEIAYLLLVGELPNEEELKEFKAELGKRRTLPQNFFRDVIMKAPSKDMMISLSKSILTLYSYDSDAENTSLSNVMRQCLNLISQFPMLAVYSYHAYNQSIGNSLFIHPPKEELSTAENILMMLRPNKKYTKFEAAVLDLALVLHMEHGGGNNSSFTTRVVSSSGTDTYSVMAAALGSLKGPRHGGANIKVMQMFEDLKAKVYNWEDQDEVANYLRKVLRKEEFDQSGLIYGIGHAVYSISDPRAEIFKIFVEELAKNKGQEAEFNLYTTVEKLAPKLIAEERRIYKGVNTNVDFYSGFVYHLLGLPLELYTPIFAIARIVGWSAHRLEEIVSAEKIIRPAYQSIATQREYSPLDKRQ